jgi:uncharacterized OB-fold protein
MSKSSELGPEELAALAAAELKKGLADGTLAFGRCGGCGAGLLLVMPPWFWCGRCGKRQSVAVGQGH